MGPLLGKNKRTVMSGSTSTREGLSWLAHNFCKKN
jgi:hypothetical protein